MRKTLRKALWFFMAVNLLLYAPCAIVGISDIFDLMFESVYRIYIWQYSGFMMFTMPLVLTRCFYVNYLLFIILAVLQGFYIHECKECKYKYNYKMPGKEKIIYIVVWVILIIGVLSCEHVFWGAMSV